MSLWELVRSCYQTAVHDWHLAPSEFWLMPVEEWWWLYDRGRQEARARAGVMSQDELDDLDEWFHANKDRYAKHG